MLLYRSRRQPEHNQRATAVPVPSVIHQMPKICLMCGESFPDTTTFCPKDGSALRAAVVGDDLIGELIADRYLITDLISQGGMGAVYLASDVRLPQKFAVKVLRQQQAPDPTLISRFRQEAEAVCRINHDRVARVFDFGFMTDDRAYIIMEYVAGRTLRRILEERGALDPVESARIIHMAAEGIDAAHRLGIVHRDLKPENIMILDDPGGGTRVKVLDFGIAKLQGAEPGQGQTQPGFVIGTPAWMSPEQLLGKEIDARSDIYSLGLLAFALLTGVRPFTGESEQAEMLARISTTPRTLAEAEPAVKWPRDLQELFDSTLSREATQRPATTLQFANALFDIVTQWKDGVRGRAKSAPSGFAPVIPKFTPTVSSTSASSAASTGPTTPTGRRTLVMSVIGVTVVGAAALTFALTRASAGKDLAEGTTRPSMTASEPPTPITDTQSAAPRESLPVAAPAGQIPAPADPGNTKGTESPRRDAPGTKPDPQRPPLIEPAKPNAATTPAPPTASPAPGGSAQRNAELARIMRGFDSDELNETQTIAQIEALSGTLTGVDRAWAQIYVGLSHYGLGDKTKACAAFERASTLAGDFELVRKDSEEKRMKVGCRP